MAQATSEQGGQARLRTPDPSGAGQRRDIDAPTDLRARSWGGALRRSVREFREDNLTDWAAALTYYSILSIFPATLALVSILGVVGHSATQPLIENLGKVAPGPARQIFTSAVENLQKDHGSAGGLIRVRLAGG